MTIESIKDTLKSIMETKINIVLKDEADFQKNLVDIGMNSLLFVKLLIGIEVALGIAFEEEIININYLTNLDKLAQYIAEQVKPV